MHRLPGVPLVSGINSDPLTSVLFFWRHRRIDFPNSFISVPLFVRNPVLGLHDRNLFNVTSLDCLSEHTTQLAVLQSELNSLSSYMSLKIPMMG